MKAYKTNLVYYDNYQEVYKKPASYFDSLAKLVEGKKNISVLDIGCGFGDFLESIRKVLGDKATYYGLTIAKHEYDHIKENRQFINITLGKEQDIKELFKNQQFDIIINLHTLSYIKQDLQVETVKSMNALLKEEGSIILGLIDDWIKINSKIKQSGGGYVQFNYSPFIFRELCKNYKLISSFKKDNYRVHLWEKSGGKMSFLPILYILRNNIFHLGLLLKLFKKL